MAGHPKVSDLLNLVREKVETGKLRYSAHAKVRMQERSIIRPEVEYVLKNGHHNKRKDKFVEEQNSWDYAIEGTTVDKRKLRIVVAVVEPGI